jgi:putative pyruvate formate lyase activating enzyme
VLLAVPMGLRLPLVYNSGGYDSLATIRALDGIFDIYLPDLRYASDAHAEAYSQAPGYVTHSRAAIKEMFRQVGELDVADSGVAERGLVVRHLILPNNIAGSKESLTWLAREVSPRVTVSIMSQYSPQHRAGGIPELSRTISRDEYDDVLRLLDELELENGWVQEMTAYRNYLPHFEREGHPFAIDAERGD